MCTDGVRVSLRQDTFKPGYLGLYLYTHQVCDSYFISQEHAGQSRDCAGARRGTLIEPQKKKISPERTLNGLR